MKKLVATEPRVAALVEYEDRAVSANEVKVRVKFGAPKHGTEVVDFRAASPFIDEDFNGEWQMFMPRPEEAPRGIEFGKFQLGNMVVGDVIECGSDVTEYAVGDSVCGYGPLAETVFFLRDRRHWNGCFQHCFSAFKAADDEPVIRQQEEIVVMHFGRCDTVEQPRFFPGFNERPAGEAVGSGCRGNAVDHGFAIERARSALGEDPQRIVVIRQRFGIEVKLFCLRRKGRLSGIGKENGGSAHD